MPVTKFTLTAPEIGYEKTITLNIEETPQYIVHFQRLSDYDGEFGFDWMRKEYLPTTEGGQGVCVEGLDELKKIYTPFKIDLNHKDTGKPYGNYYVPWLTMFPNHKEKIGKEVRLLVTIAQEYISAEFYTNTEEEFFSFEASIPVLRVEPPKISADEAINGVKIIVYCDVPLQQDAFIEVKSSKKALVGKLNVMRNAHHKDLTMNIYVIKSYLTDNPTYGKEIVDTKLTELGGLQVIEDYLNKKSLNQALIQVKLIEIDPTTGKPFDWGFRKISLVNASTEEKYKDMFDSSAMKVETGKYMNYINDRFEKMFPPLTKKKNILLYISSLESISAGGAAYMLPLNNKHCIIFRNNIKHLSSYSHEIGHTLGLAHLFSEEPISIEEQISDVESKKVNRVQEKRNWFRDKASQYVNNPRLREEHTRIFDEGITYYEEKLEILRNNKYIFIKEQTENVMDYDLNNQKTFTKWQIKIMQAEVRRYYH